MSVVLVLNADFGPLHRVSVRHAIRMLWGGDHRFLIPAAALLGATFLVLADALARTAAAPTELPVGVVTAFVGVPFFVWLLRRRGG